MTAPESIGGFIIYQYIVLVAGQQYPGASNARQTKQSDG